NERQCGCQRYSRTMKRPSASARSRSVWSHAMFSAPLRAAGSIQMSGSRVSRLETRDSSPIRLDGRARADQIAVAVRLVDAAYRRPDLVPARGGGRERRMFARVGPQPAVCGELAERMRRPGQHVVAARLLARLDCADLVANADHRMNEAVE